MDDLDFVTISDRTKEMIELSTEYKQTIIDMVYLALNNGLIDEDEQSDYFTIRIAPEWIRVVRQEVNR